MKIPQQMDLIKLVDRFHSEDACREYLEGVRWPNGVICPKCGSRGISRIFDRGQFDCNSCRYQFSVMSGTILHDTHLPLSKWLIATYLMIEAKKGVSANQLKRTLDVNYRTAWYLCHRIRAAVLEVNPRLLTGTVEVDETYVGGKTRGKGHGYKGNKTAVIGAVERGGQVRMQVISQADRETLHGFIKSRLADETKNIYTDQWPAYNGVGDENTKHDSVNHSIEEWVRGDIHTNTVEGVWSLFKRSVVGSYHQVSKKHLDAYLDEIEWKYNQRKNPWLFRDTIIRLLSADSLPLKQLVAK